MPKLSRKEWFGLLTFYGIAVLFLVALPFVGIMLKKGILSIPGLKSTYQNITHHIGQWITHWMPAKAGLYFAILVGMGVLYFLSEDILNLIRGKRDKIPEKDLPIDDQILREVAREYGEKEPLTLGKTPSPTLSSSELQKELSKTRIDPNIQKRILETAKNQEMASLQTSTQSRFDRSLTYSRVIYYWIITILMMGFVWAWAMAIMHPTQTTGLKPVSFTILGISIYLFYLANSCTKKIFLDDQHVWMGKNENELLCEKDYTQMYYMNVLVRNLFSIRKTYTLIVFRKRFCIPPLAYLIDRFFPASNQNRQVIFMNIWKDEEGEMVPDTALIKRILDHCDLNGVKVKYWPWEAQFFMMAIFFFIGLFLFIHHR